MRYLGILLVVVSLPVFIYFLKSKPQRMALAAFAVGLLPFTIDALNLDAALVNWDMWPGHTKGLIVTLLDSLALAILFSHRRSLGLPPLLFVFLLYIVAAFVSVLVSDVWLASTFYATQLIRVLLVFLAVTLLVRDHAPMRSLCHGLAAGAIIQAAFSISQKFSGVVQASGTMGHQNLLGMMLHFAVIPLVAIILGGNRDKLVICGAIAGLVAAVLTASRATIGFLCVGLAVLVIASLIRKATAIKWRALVAGICAFAILVPFALTALGNRTAEEIASGDAEREAFERAAVNMWNDHPFGVGANRYVIVANTQGYSDEAGVIAVSGSRAAHVHNIYLLHAAEMGWLGLVAFLSVIVASIVRGLVFAIKERDNPAGDLVLGATIAILVLAVHGYFEWIIVLNQPLYLLAIAMGVVAASPRHADAATKERQQFRRRDPIVEHVMR